MKSSTVVFEIVLLSMTAISSCHYHHHNHPSQSPLILTPLIERNRIDEAQRASEVHLEDFKSIKSYSGYFTVDKTHDSNLFFWFVPAKRDFANAPVILWLEGGPGASSLIGLFLEHGPVTFENGTPTLKEYSWTDDHSVLYIDNPVGTGFSFTKDGYARNETKIGEDLYSALTQFFKMFPSLRKNDFFVFGSSYGAKYVVSIAYTIHKKNQQTNTKINLKGTGIGNGFCDPENQLQHGEYLYQVGLIDLNTYEYFSRERSKIVGLIRNGLFDEAFDVADKLIGESNSTLTNVTGFNSPFNILYLEDQLTEGFGYMVKYLQRPDVMAAIHVGNTSFGKDFLTVATALKTDIMQSVAPWVSELLTKYRMLFYNGQLDFSVAYPSTLHFLQHLKFDGADEYKKAQRHKWFVEKELAGYVKQAGKMTEVLVRNAGHMVPSDKPKWALDLVSKFVRNQPLYAN